MGFKKPKCRNNLIFLLFQMKNNVSIYGGFAGNEPNSFDLSDRDFMTNETILSGDLNGDDNPATPVEDLLNDPNRADNCYHIFFHSSSFDLDLSAVLDGFTITAGNADDDSFPNNSGGGMYNYSNSPTIIGCIFQSISYFVIHCIWSCIMEICQWLFYPP